MVQELVYTSVENGLIAGTRGFATVAMTEGLSTQSRQLLESLSGYTHVYTGHNSDYSKNPVVWSHLISPQGDSIMSRVAAYDFDYTGRTNKLAHHWLLSGERQLPDCGPVAIMRSSNVFFDEWRFKPTTTEKGRLQLQVFQNLAEPSARAVTWGATRVGEKGAAALVQFFKNSQKAKSGQPAYIIFDPEDQQTDLLALVAEASALLEPAERWQVTFSTYFTAIPIGMKCDWRFCLKDDATFLRQRDRSMWIDLSDGTINNAPFDYTHLTNVAITGQRPVVNSRMPKTSPQVIDMQCGEGGGASLGRLPLKLKETNTRQYPQQPMRRVFDVPVKSPQQDYSMLIMTAIAFVAVLFLGVILFNKYTKKTTPPPTVVMDGALSPSGSRTNDVPQKPESIRSKELTAQEVSRSNMATTIEISNTNQLTVKKQTVSAEDISKEVPQPEVKKQQQPIKDEQSAKEKKGKIVYSYKLIKDLSPDTVPADVLDETVAESNKWIFCAISPKGSPSQDWTTSKGEYTPKYESQKGKKGGTYKTKEGERTSSDFSAILFEKAGHEYKYLWLKKSIEIKPVVVRYPETNFEIKEMNTIPPEIIEGFNKAGCFSVCLYIGTLQVAKIISKADVFLTKSPITIDYLKEFDQAIDGFIAKLTPETSKAYSEYLKKLGEEERKLHEEEKKLQADEPELNKLKDELKDLKVKTEKNHPKNPGRINDRQEAIRKKEKNISELEGKKNDKDKAQSEVISKQRKVVEDLKSQRADKLKTLEKKVPITMTILLPDLVQDGGISK